MLRIFSRCLFLLLTFFLKRLFLLFFVTLWPWHFLQMYGLQWESSLTSSPYILLKTSIFCIIPHSTKSVYKTHFHAFTTVMKLPWHCTFQARKTWEMKCKLHVEFNYIKSSFFKERIKKGKGLPQVVHILLHSLPYSGDDTSSKRLTLYEQPLCDGLFL